jgi:hypothetical protein
MLSWINVAVIPGALKLIQSIIAVRMCFII